MSEKNWNKLSIAGLIAVGILLLLFSPLTVSAEKEDKIQKIKEYIEEALNTYNIPGGALVILENGETFYQDQWGVLSDGSVVTADTPFLIGSLSKPITSLAIMMLVEDGSIKLDEPIQSYLPSFSYQTDSSTPITVLHLLEQTSGISEYEGLKVTDVERESKGAITQAVTELSGVELSHDPGETYEYNSANYLLLGAIIEKVTNQTVSEFMNQNIFTPLGMDHSAADYETAVDKGYVPGFESWFGKPIKSDGFYDNAGASYGYIASSTNDLAKFLTYMVEGGDLLSEQYLELIKTPPEEGKTYGLGWHFSKEEHFPFHGGATPDFRAEMFFIPEQDVAAALLTNKYHITEDTQVSNIMKGIRSIMNETDPDELPEQSYSLQWIILGITIFLAILTVVHFFRLRSKKNLNKKILLVSGIVLLLVSVGFVPLFSYVTGSPWKSVSLYAPDLAILIYCLAAIFAINGVMTLSISLLKK
ncbi:serine hydrolase domain-containing protein [Salibacterium aidingense]|uniref:serine hydrolase domain-containing protein n=1 Tax=Salibacterium aidingense TaxID=384933 RepID=UPI0003F546DD|nr:serine hydrolase domain-containing protein [Salibacterium aidingense]